jgi:hypothetical protein
MGDFTGPIILYDPAIGTSEFFILEYRTASSPNGPGYDANVAQSLFPYCSIVSGSAMVTCPSTAGLLPGQSISGPGIPINATIKSVSSSTTFMMSANATITSFLTLTLGSSGLAIWHVQQDASYNPTSVQNVSGNGLDAAVWNEGRPNLVRGGRILWNSDATTPYLTWINGTPTKTRIHVRPFSPGDGSITVEWLSEENTWVDFRYTGTYEFGIFDAPWKTLDAGINAVSYGGILNFKTGSAAETRTINTPMTLKAYNGPVTIGRN